MRIHLLAAFAAAFTLNTAAADEISDTIEAALEAYQAGDTKLAKEELDFAAQLLSQLKAEGLTGFLPAPLDGWTRDDTESQASGAAAFGGGQMASASYSNGSQDMEIRLMADNPMVAAMAATLGNSAMMAALGTVKRVNRQKLVVTPDGSVQALIDGRILLQVDGSASVEDKLAHVEAMDLDGLKAF